MPAPKLPPGFDFTDPDIYAERLPVEELAEMRKAAPIWWNEQPVGKGAFDDGGFWVVSKHKDVKEVSLRSDVFSSLKKTALPRYKDGTVQEQVDRGKFVLLNMDAPHHTHLRKIISRAFTPRAKFHANQCHLPRPAPCLGARMRRPASRCRTSRRERS